MREQAPRHNTDSHPPRRLATRSWVLFGFVFGTGVGVVGNALYEHVFDGQTQHSSIALGALCGMVSGYYQGRRNP